MKIGRTEFRCVEKNSASLNRLYHGNNLDALLALCRDDNIRGKIDLVYIDPPYATSGNFSTRDNRHAYQDQLQGGHFVESIRRRLILLHELLSDSGTIYIHMDQRMIFDIKIVMDEIFGSDRFKNFITRKKCNPKNYTKKTFGNISDYILVYSKGKNPIWNRQTREWSEEGSSREYQYFDEKGRQFKKVPIHAPGVRNGETGKPWRGMLPPPGKHWQYTPEKLDALDAAGDIYWSPTGNPRRKVYLENSSGIPYSDIWLDFKDAHNQNIKVSGYPTEKNLEMLELIVKASSNPGSLILDCYAGSGTTMAAAESQNRNWIGIDNSPVAIEIIKRRLSHGLERMGDFVNSKKTNSRPGTQESIFPRAGYSYFEGIG